MTTLTYALIVVGVVFAIVGVVMLFSCIAEGVAKGVFIFGLGVILLIVTLFLPTSTDLSIDTSSWLSETYTCYETQETLMLFQHDNTYHVYNEVNYTSDDGIYTKIDDNIIRFKRGSVEYEAVYEESDDNLTVENLDTGQKYKFEG